MNSKIISATIGIMLASMSLQSFAFTDTSGNMHETAANYLKEKGIVNGYADGSYKPNNPITRAEFTKIVFSTKFSKDEIKKCNTHVFKDVSKTAWFAPYICFAKQKNIIGGYSDNTFRPNNSVTFIEAVKIISNTYGYQGEDTPDLWYKKYIQILADKNAIPTDIKNVNDTITRGQMASMIHRLQENIENQASHSTESILGIKEEAVETPSGPTLGEILGKNTDFIWTDLSTFDVDKTKDFYGKIFDWKFIGVEDRSMDNTYFAATQNNADVSAVFEMPQYLQDKKLPSFWMSYIIVEDLDAVVAQARKQPGVIVEVEPVAFDEKSRIALLRDPAGAGFTVYEGPARKGRFTYGVPGRLRWNVLHVSKLEKVQSFYEETFGWQFRQVDGNPDKYEIYNPQRKLIAHLEIVPETVRDVFEYWMPIFDVADVNGSLTEIKNAGGKHVASLPENRKIITDPQGGTFIIAQDLETLPTNPPTKNLTDSRKDQALRPTPQPSSKPSRNSGAS